MFSKKLKELRINNKLSQKQIAEQMNISQQA
ncbi:TPA: helix-turn-helix domain-containing protein, partial [Streptococcus agalactiae]|nr:helix-turn-helix domain-containing protein [Streptococcus agalactiae]HEN0820255.1 helix-turn-helix domain-containing protein [Streptococcus agalactiae]